VLHDGQNVFLSGGPFGGWQVDATLDRDYPDVLAVAIDNGADRFATYTPVADDIGSGPIGGDAATYLAFVEDDVLPFVRARYGVRATGPSLMIAGSSLGGLVSLEGAHTRPALAGCVAGLSSTLGWGAFDGDGSGTLVRRWSTHGTTAIYLDSGGGGVCGDSDGDGVHEDSDDRDNYCVTLQLRDHLVGLGYELGVDLFHWHEPGAPHSEAAWAARVGRFLDACVSGGWIAE
jgi:predicted alpha/beta superfamily hydrolase